MLTEAKVAATLRSKGSRVIMEKISKFLQDSKWILWATGILWAVFVYINTMNGLPGRVSRLEEQQIQLAQEHQKIYDRMAEDEKHFEVITIELKTMVSQVITDLTFIRTELFK